MPDLKEKEKNIQSRRFEVSDQLFQIVGYQ